MSFIFISLLVSCSSFPTTLLPPIRISFPNHFSSFYSNFLFYFSTLLYFIFSAFLINLSPRPSPFPFLSVLSSAFSSFSLLVFSSFSYFTSLFLPLINLARSSPYIHFTCPTLLPSSFYFLLSFFIPSFCLSWLSFNSRVFLLFLSLFYVFFLSFVIFFLSFFLFFYRT